ncbi:MAG TPA: response regulator [Candidatus Saccharimonadales bacterium]|nr:response regulator [Candidatus Saccharimonadales bacterium]
MQTKRVLIVEDEAPLAHALSLKLGHEGCETAIADSGQACLDILESQQFDVLLLDLVMPVVDGFQVLEKLQHAPKRPVIFALSNLSQQDDEKRALSLGAQKFFVKSNTPLAVIVQEVKAV